MNRQTIDFRPRRGRPSLAVMTTATALVLSFAVMAGCGPSGSFPQSTTGNAPARTLNVSTEHCEAILDNALSSMQPDRLGLTSERRTAAADLNEWASNCGFKAVPAEPFTAAQEAELEKLLTPEEIERTRAEMFGTRDIVHIRNSLWYKRTVERFAAEITDDLQRAVALFYYVVRNIDLVDEADAEVPLTPYDFTLIGKGTAADRAWLFTDLLRQLRLDAVLLVPGETDFTAAEHSKVAGRLVGVLIGEDVYLFDTQLGLPIPADVESAETVLPLRPATLREVQDNPQLLAALSVDEEHPYPIDAERLKSPAVLVGGTSSIWSDRMRRLQRSLTGDRAVFIYDPLVDGSVGQGIVTRVAEFSGASWSRSDIAVWKYPEDRSAGAVALDEQQQAEWERQQAAFQTPVPIASIDEQTMTIKDFAPPQNRQMEARNAQLLGEYDTAVLRYLTIRLWGGMPPLLIKKDPLLERRKDESAETHRRARDSYIEVPQPLRPRLASQTPPEILEAHRRAAEDASFWVGLCQMERGRFEEAANTFRTYLDQYRDGNWFAAAQYLRCVALARSDHLNDAIRELETADGDNPQSAGNQLLLRRWRALRETRQNP